MTEATKPLISTNLFRDRNIPFPIRPRLIEDLHTFVMPDGLGVQIRGVPKPMHLSGATVRDALPWLLSLLDGQHTREELQAKRPEIINESQLDELLLTLFTKGLIQDGAVPELVRLSPQQLDDVERKQLLFWGRNLGITFAHAFPETVRAKLVTAKVTFLGNGLFGAVAYDVLRRAGMPNVTAFDCGSDRYFSKAFDLCEDKVTAIAPDDDESVLKTLKPALVGTDLLVTATRIVPNSLLESINLLCVRERVKWLRATDAFGSIEIGPFFDPLNTACYMCCRIRQASSILFSMEEELFERDFAKTAPSDRNILEGESLALATMAGGMLAMEATNILSMIAPASTTNAVITMSLSSPFSTNHFLKVPRCPHCYRGETNATID